LIDPKFGDALYNFGILEARTDPSSVIEYTQDLKADPTNASGSTWEFCSLRGGRLHRGDSYLRNQLRPALSADIPSGITVPSP
jgi:hypothetical protein